MASVTARVREVKQPRGGYIKPSQFEEISFNDGKVLGEENVHASIIGIVVDYMTRYMSGAKVEDAFRISIEGYESRLIVKAKLFCPEIAGLFCRIAGLFCHDSRANLSLKPVCFGIAIS